MKKDKVILLFGGNSAEHSISLSSAFAVITHIDQTKWEIYPVGITKAGEFFYYRGPFSLIETGEWEKDPALLSPVYFGYRAVILSGQPPFYPRAILPVLHGGFGEDGRLQGLFSSLELPYVGCDSLCSALCMHKHLTKLVFAAAGIPTAKWISLSKSALNTPKAIEETVYATLGTDQLFVKPSDGGSSLGACPVSAPNQLLPALEQAFRYSDTVLVEERLRGRECEVGIFFDTEMLVSRPASISTQHDFYDFDAKYKEKNTLLELPAPIPQAAAKQMQDYAKKAFLALRCRHLSRFDFFLCDDGRILLSEVNTLPGMTSRSLFPAMMQDQGLAFGEWISRLLEVAAV